MLRIGRLRDDGQRFFFVVTCFEPFRELHKILEYLVLTAPTGYSCYLGMLLMPDYYYSPSRVGFLADYIVYSLDIRTSRINDFSIECLESVVLPLPRSVRADNYRATRQHPGDILNHTDTLFL
jgi:hypothetical protein